MKKLLLAVAIAASLPLAVSAKPFVGKNIGQGFSGITGDFTSAQYNPALLAKFDQDDDAYFSIGVGALASDEDELIDSIEETQDFVDLIDERIESGYYTEPEDAQADIDTLVAALEELDGKTLTAEPGVNLMLAIPMDTISVGLVLSQEARLGSWFEYDENDAQAIEDYIYDELTESTNSDDLGEVLGSGGAMIGYSITDAGVILAKTWSDEKVDVNYGITLKHQRIDMFNYTDTISNFDEDNFDADDYLVDESQFNLDLGIQVAWGQERSWQAGMVIKNLNGIDATSGEDPLGNRYTLKIDPTATVGASYDNGWFRFALDADLNSHSEFSALGEVQYLSAGVEFDAWEWAQLRFGYRSDLEDNVDNLASVGIGLSPFDVLSLDISAVVGENDTVGGAVQLGIKF